MVVKKTCLILQYLEKYSSTIQELARGDWHGVNKQESYRLEEGEETGDGGAERSSPTGDGRQAVIPLTPDADGTGSGSLLDSILSILLSGLICENSTETHAFPRVKQRASGSLTDDVGNPELVLSDNLEGWDREGVARSDQEGGDTHEKEHNPVMSG